MNLLRRRRGETITFDSGTTSSGIDDGATSAGLSLVETILGSFGEDTVVFDED